MNLETYLRQEVQKYENIGDFVYFNFKDEVLMTEILNQAKKDFNMLLNQRVIMASYTIYLSLVYLQLKYYSNSFWEPVRQELDIYKNTNLSNQIVDAHLRNIIDLTHGFRIEEINRQSIKVQFDSGISFPHLMPLYEICYDYYYKDLECGLTDTEFLEEAEFLLEGLKHKFQSETFEEDEITINSRVYNIIKATRLRILYSHDIMADLLREILNLIDSHFWESIDYKSNHFIIKHFEKWAERALEVKKKHLDIKSFVNKENTEHIVRKPNLYMDHNEIYFKVPNQKMKVIDESLRTNLHIHHDNKTETYIPSIKRQMIGYLLTGGKVVVKNPFTSFGYRLKTRNEVLYENNLDLCDYYIFNEKTGSRLSTLEGIEGKVVLITRLNANLHTKNAKIIISLKKEHYHIHIIEINSETVLSIEGHVLSSYPTNQSGILIDSFKNIKYIYNRNEYEITRTKPLLVIPEILGDSRLLLKINGKNYDDLNQNSINNEGTLFTFSKIEFKTGVYDIEVENLSNNTIIYTKSFYYNPVFRVTFDKVLYYHNEKPRVTLNIGGATYNESIEKAEDNILFIRDFGLYLKIEIPYIYWMIKDHSETKSEVFLENLPSRCILQTLNISDLEIQGIEIYKKKTGKFIEFDLSEIHNIKDRSVVSVRANTSRGKVFLFKIILRDFIDEKQCIINYNENNQCFEGFVDYVGLKPLSIIITSKDNMKREVVKNNRFNIEFPLRGSAELKFVTTKSDEFGLFNNEDNVLLIKNYKFFSPNSLINKILVSEKKFKNLNKKSELTTSLCNVRINKHLGNNIFLGSAFVPLLRGDKRKRQLMDVLK